MEDGREAQIAGMDRFLRGEAPQFLGPNGTLHRRVWRDGREFYERVYADGATASDEITPGVRALFLELAEQDRADEMDFWMLRRLGIPPDDQDRTG